jgi:AAA+ superfamily predicted ATPase
VTTPYPNHATNPATNHATNHATNDVLAFVETLRRQLDGIYPLLVIETDDEDGLRTALFDAVRSDLPYREWTAVRGLGNARLAGDAIAETTNASAALAWMPANESHQRSVTVFYDLGVHLADPRVARALKEAVTWARRNFCSIVLVEHRVDLSAATFGALAAEAHRIAVPSPSEADLSELVRATVREVSRSRKIEASVRRSTLEAMARGLRGLTRRQAERVVLAAVTEDNRFDDSDLERMLLLKRNACADLEGVLEFVQAPVSMDEIGGLAQLKKWLDARHLGSIDEAEEFGLTLPRGVLLLGVQGAGKSLAAKAVATAWRVPLLKLDAGALFDKYIGESERRLRDSLAQADRMAPAVLWIDEIEKGFASASSQSSDGGLSRRMFGTLLTWMQERRSATFLVATANDISALPPELLRKGRFDEVFFVDLPNESVRRMILSIHLRKRRRDPAQFDLGALAAATHGFSGAEIEAGIESALRRAFADDRRALTDRDLLETFHGSPPISVVMAEKVAELRAWAAQRCVSAD